jgi:hypothetical protein
MLPRLLVDRNVGCARFFEVAERDHRIAGTLAVRGRLQSPPIALGIDDRDAAIFVEQVLGNDAHSRRFSGAGLAQRGNVLMQHALGEWKFLQTSSGHGSCAHAVNSCSKLLLISIDRL